MENTALNENAFLFITSADAMEPIRPSQDESRIFGVIKDLFL